MDCDPVGGFDRGHHKKDHTLVGIRAETTKNSPSGEDKDNVVLSSISNLESKVQARLSNMESTIDGRIGGLKQEFIGRTDGLEKPIHERFEALDGRFKAMDERFTRIEQLLERLFSERSIGNLGS